MTEYNVDAPKAPRWITTKAGQWAWHEQLPWRGDAAKALSVDDRLRLLQEAERLQKTHDDR